MADKEERITIHKVLYPCKKCSINCNKSDWKDCDFYQNYISGMTRQEAIEKISHALCTKVHGACEICEAVAGGNENHCNDYRTYAEAALNALLENKK